MDGCLIAFFFYFIQPIALLLLDSILSVLSKSLKIKFVHAFPIIMFISYLQANPDYKGVCHVALAQEGHWR
jgi:hypothetical protein